MMPVDRQQCVWSLIKECVPDSEIPEIRAILGDALIDMYTEIYSEVQMWEQIWHEVHDGKSQMPHSPLADPPAVKELLRSELQLLLLNLRQQAAAVGRDGDEVVSRYSSRVVTYALCTERQQSPDSTECPKENSRPESSRSSSRLTSHSSIKDEIEALQHKLNIIHINEVVSHLQSVLIEECEALKHDVHMLQESVELDYMKQSSFHEPTVTELKRERRLIQQDLNLMNESTGTSIKSGVSQIRSRQMKMTALANDSEKKEPVAAVSPRTDLLQPKPPPAIYKNRSSFLGQTRHRIPLKAAQLPRPSPDLAQLHKPDLENSHIQPVIHTSSGCSATLQNSTSVSEIAYVGSASRLGHIGAESVLTTQPVPPSGQRSSSRVQRVGKHLALNQTENLLSATGML